MVLAASRQSYAEADVAAALKTTYPEGLYAGNAAAPVAPVEIDELYDPEGDYVPAEDEIYAVEEALDDDGSTEPIEERDAINILMTWKQTRSQINKEKNVKGFWRRDSDLKKMEARVRCFKCKKVGHFSRNCLSRKGQGKGSGASSTSSTARVSGFDQ